ncbi:hypothetical protein [Neobacillus mesonae]|uniref:hypothetical protein n=1 Tax=Neobacillus mesonae TaxID=1193713 RepID=UPI00203FF759|nr:hypothetical protein [Neobacillus mesonae]MCM3566970.1 hypothetical protein [Neobacillus mesonae]
MKTLIVMSLLTISMVILSILLDLALGYRLNGILVKQLKGFRVTELTEIVILLLFAIYFVIKAIVGFVKKKQQKQNAQ